MFGAGRSDRSRIDLLAGAGLTGDQDGCIGACDRRHLAENGSQATSAPYDRI